MEDGWDLDARWLKGKVIWESNVQSEGSNIVWHAFSLEQHLKGICIQDLDCFILRYIFRRIHYKSRGNSLPDKFQCPDHGFLQNTLYQAGAQWAVPSQVSWFSLKTFDVLSETNGHGM